MSEPTISLIFPEALKYRTSDERGIYWRGFRLGWLGEDLVFEPEHKQAFHKRERTVFREGYRLGANKRLTAN